jgi:nucleoside phosphorylase/tetratricopeptide (TPR) repeat protein
VDAVAVVVLTALELELLAVRNHLTGVQKYWHDKGTPFEVGELPGGVRIAICSTSMGNVAAGVLTERAIHMFEPGAVLFVGVAGRLHGDLDLGDLVVGTKIYSYHGGRAGGAGFLARPDAWPAPHELEQLAKDVARSRSWHWLLPADRRDRPPRVEFRPIAAGEVVLDSLTGPIAEHLRQTYDDAAVIDMESAGFARAAHYNNVPGLAIRAVSDTASGAKIETDKLGWQPTAAANAAAFAIALAGAIAGRIPAPAPREDRKPPIEARWRRAMVLASGPVVAAAAAVVTNLVTNAWSWALASALVVFIGVAAVLAVVVDLGGDAGRRPEPASPVPITDAAIGTGAEDAPNTLPRDVGGFAGRDAELRRLLDAADDTQTIAIHAVDGMAGVGKTTLAVHAAYLLAPRYPDAQLYVNLRGYLSDQEPMRPDEALEVLLVALGVPLDTIPPSADARTALWRTQLAQRRAVVVLDNAAHGEQVDPLLPGTPRCLVLVTSRRRLALAGVYPLSLDTLPALDAAALFTSIVGAARVTGQRADVEAAVARCGYLPLAIEVAAGWLLHRPSKTVADLLTALGSPPDAVRAALRLSYRGLDAGTRRLFRRLGLHPGPDITPGVAAALDGTDTPRARTALDVLYEHNLVQEPTRNRYRLHDLIRQFAQDLVGDEPQVERGAAVRRLLDSYLAAAVSAGRLLGPGIPGTTDIQTAFATDPTFATDVQARGWFGTELPNLLACARLAVDDAVAPYAWKLPSVIGTFLRDQGYALQARPLHIGALRVATAVGDRLGQANAHVDLGTLDQLAGNQAVARTHFDEALRLYDDLGERLGQANAQVGLGILGQILGEYNAARTRFTAAVAAYDELGDRHGAAYAHVELGAVAQLHSRFDDARAHAANALQLYTDLGSHAGQAEAHTNLGALERHTGDRVAARTHLLRALDLHAAPGGGRARAYTLVQLGALDRAEGDYGPARTRLDEALHGYREAGDRTGMAFAYSQLGMLHRALWDFQAARTNFEQALTIYRGVGNQAGEANTLTSLGILDRLMGDHTAATSNLDRAMAIYTDLDSLSGQADVHTELATVARTTGALNGAREHLRRALELWAGLADRRAEEATRAMLADLPQPDDRVQANGLAPEVAT